jgi:diketogulonate reductase-like aldo/keto reductase
MSSSVRATVLPNGANVPVLGQGTWKMGEDRRRRADEVAALRLGIDLGMTLIDTAEMYADGESEAVVREAIGGRRDEVFLVSKVLPSNASRAGVARACEQSLKRLGILGWGVSNFDMDDMEELASVPGGEFVQTNQVLYNLSSRGIDYDLLPKSMRDGIPLMAYSPVGQGGLTRDKRLAAIGERHGATAAQIALAWTLRHPHVIAIPKAASVEHVRDNRAALDIELTEADLAELDAAFPPPRRKRPLEMG